MNSWDRISDPHFKPPDYHLFSIELAVLSMATDLPSTRSASLNYPTSIKSVEIAAYPSSSATDEDGPDALRAKEAVGMCGITGRVSYNCDLTFRHELIDAKTTTMAGVETDAPGSWARRQVGVGHRRLTVIDLLAAGSRSAKYTCCHSQRRTVSRAHFHPATM